MDRLFAFAYNQTPSSWIGAPVRASFGPGPKLSRQLGALRRTRKSTRWEHTLFTPLKYNNIYHALCLALKNRTDFCSEKSLICWNFLIVCFFLFFYNKSNISLALDTSIMVDLHPMRDTWIIYSWQNGLDQNCKYKKCRLESWIFSLSRCYEIRATFVAFKYVRSWYSYLFKIWRVRLSLMFITLELALCRERRAVRMECDWSSNLNEQVSGSQILFYWSRRTELVTFQNEKVFDYVIKLKKKT